MLIQHFLAKTQGFQGLVDQNDRMESLSPRKITFSERNIFLRGFQSEESGRIRATGSPMHIINENIYFFDIAGKKPAFRKIYRNILKYIWP